MTTAMATMDERTDSAERDMVTIDPRVSKSHRLAARLLALGVAPASIAAHVDITEGTLQKYQHDPRVVALMENLEQLARDECLINREIFNVALAKSIKLIESSVDDEDLPIETRLRAAYQILDRHPDGQFIKSSKQRVETTSAIDEDGIASLKRRAIEIQAEVIIPSFSSPLPDSPHTQALPQAPENLAAAPIAQGGDGQGSHAPQPAPPAPDSEEDDHYGHV